MNGRKEHKLSVKGQSENSSFFDLERLWFRSGLGLVQAEIIIVLLLLLWDFYLHNLISFASLTGPREASSNDHHQKTIDIQSGPKTKIAYLTQYIELTFQRIPDDNIEMMKLHFVILNKFLERKFQSLSIFVLQN